MLPVMINPSNGALASIAHLVPAKTLTVEFLHNVVSSVLEVIHSPGGYVFSLMCDKLLKFKKTPKMFYETFESLGFKSIAYPQKNLKFKVTFHIIVFDIFI